MEDHDPKAQEQAPTIPAGILLALPDGIVSANPADVLAGALCSTGYDVGCCGSNGGDGPNQACSGCGAVLGMERSDCWTPPVVGFVSDIPDGPAWLASQSFAILRLRRRGPITDPAILFRFLSSSMGQVTVQSLKVGSVISGLQMAALRRLPVLVPSADAQGAIAAQMNAIFDMQEKIQQMHRDLTERQQAIWPEMDREPSAKPPPVALKKEN